MARRHWLVLGAFGLIVSAASRVTAAGPSQVEAEGYAGTSVGEWGCGPTARASYGGVGGHVRVYTDDQPPSGATKEEAAGGALKPDPEPPVENAEPVAELPPAPPVSARQQDEDGVPNLEPHGPSFGGGAGTEYRDFTRLECSGACGPNDTVPPSRILGAARANLGWDWDYFGVRGGALVFQRWQDNNARDPNTNIVPDVEFRFGRRAGFHGGFGVGAYSVTTLFRPGGYLSFGYATGAFAAELRGGAHVVFDDQLGGRLDLSARHAVSRFVAPGLGIAVSSAERIGPEGRVFVVFTP